MCAAEKGALNRTGRGAAKAAGGSSRGGSSSGGAQRLLALLCVCGSCISAASVIASPLGSAEPRAA
eukprot:6727060-Lingulodinium_polyedra.AAC.1